MMLLSRLTGKDKKPKEETKEEDPYSGFGTDEVAAPLQTDDLEYDEGFQTALKSSHGRRPPGTSSGRQAPIATTGGGPSAARIATARGGTGTGRPVTSMGDGVNRPMTGISRYN